MRALICPTLCRYHKPGRREEPGCGGLVCLEARPGLTADLAGLAPDPARPLFGLAGDDPRLLAVCQACAYRVDGCDFRDPAAPRDQCAPCGGLRAVAGLLAAGRDLGL
ncbi:MAG: hypothetical protein ACOZHQ_13135 [Thermodesulfobacteriota bacterium]